MGIFYKPATIVNRAPIKLTVRFDGQDLDIPAFSTAQIPQVAVSFAKNQNPIMGSQDPNNPHISGARYLIGEVGVDSEEDCRALTPEEWEEHCKRPCRVDEQAMFDERYGGDPKAKLIVGGKKGKTKTMVQSRYEAADGVSGGGDGTSVFSGRD